MENKDLIRISATSEQNSSSFYVQIDNKYESVSLTTTMQNGTFTTTIDVEKYGQHHIQTDNSTLMNTVVFALYEQFLLGSSADPTTIEEIDWQQIWQPKDQNTKSNPKARSVGPGLRFLFNIKLHLNKKGNNARPYAVPNAG